MNLLRAFPLLLLAAAAAALDLPVAGATAPATATAGPLVIGDAATPWAGGGWLSLDVAVDGDPIGIIEIAFARRDAVVADARSQVSAGRGAQRDWVASISVLPGLPVRIGLPLAVLDGQVLFPPRTPGRLKAFTMSPRLALADIAGCRIRLRDTGTPQTLRVTGARLTTDEPEWPLPATPIVDALGQWTAREWPGKTPDVDTLVADLRRDRAAVPASAAAAPGHTRWGGDATRTFPATGFFRAHHDGRRWWLVDPDGGAFWSAGVDCVWPGTEASVLPGMERLLTEIPFPDDPRVWRLREGATAASFAIANLKRAFADGWPQDWTALTAHRLREWGFNTIGNWSSPDFARRSGLPWVLPMPALPRTPAMLFRDLPDVFDPAWPASAAAWAERLRPDAGDPALIGYFIANEPKWSFGTFNLASEMLEANPGTWTRRALADWVAGRYRGDSAAWAAEWRLDSATFADLVEHTHVRMQARSATAAADLWAFSRHMADRFVRVPSEAARAVAPHHLNLGLRWPWISSDLCLAALDRIDVLSINWYRWDCTGDELDRAAAAGRPIIIGEFHFGAVDRGLPAAGLKAVPDQHERGVAYRRYIETAAAHPAVVGAHWFQFADQPVLGRFDGENFNIGLVDICQRPYAELIDAARAAHGRLYRIAAGEVAPSATIARQVPNIGL